MIPVIPLLLAGVLAAVSDEDSPQVRVQKLLLLGLFSEAYEELFKLGRLDVIAEILSRRLKSRKLDVSSPVFWAERDPDYRCVVWRVTLNTSGDRFFAENIQCLSDSRWQATSEVLEFLWTRSVRSRDDGLPIEQQFDVLDALSRDKNVMQEFQVLGGKLVFHILFDRCNKALGEEFTACGQNGDWSTSAWWVGPFGLLPNMVSGDLYVIEVEEVFPNPRRFMLVRRSDPKPDDPDQNDYIYSITTGKPKQIIAAALEAREALRANPEITEDEISAIADKAMEGL
jgi:hypothetical protein